MSAALMLDHLGETDAAARMQSSVATLLADKILTPDLGGTATTAQVGEAIVERLNCSATETSTP